MNFMRLITCVTLSCVIFSITTSCNRSSNNNEVNEFEYNPDKYIYLPNFVTISSEVEEVTNFAYLNGAVYLASREMIDISEYTYTTRLFTMGVDGSDFKELTEFSPNIPSIEANMQLDIQAISADNTGSVWVFIRGSFYTYNLPPDFDGEDWGKYDYVEDCGSYFKLSKLSNTGSEQLSINFNSIVEGYIQADSLEVDNNGNVYILLNSFGNKQLFIFSDVGDLLFSLDSIDLDITKLIKLTDGTVVATGNTISPPHELSLKRINLSSMSWGENTTLMPIAQDVHPGEFDFELLINLGRDLYGFSLQTQEKTKLIYWADSNILDGTLRDVRLLPDGQILCTQRSINPITNRQTFKLILLTKTALSDLPERIVLTLATAYVDWHLNTAVVEFNSSNFVYQIDIVDYSQFATESDWRAGHKRLTTEIISGKIPDILYISGLPFRQFTNKGILEDLYQFIDSDPELNRSSFVESALLAAELNGGLYQIFSSFSINTIIGSPDVLGFNTGWNIDEFFDIINANPQATIPVGRTDFDSLIYLIIMLNIDEYIDWSNGTAHFDKGDFAKLLEFLNNILSDTTSGGQYDNQAEMIASGKQIMMLLPQYSDLSLHQVFQALFSGNIVFKGLPVEHREGNYMNINSGLAISTHCKDKEGAWAFVRTFLTEEWQAEQVRGIFGFPLNKTVFESHLREAMNPTVAGTWDWDGFKVDLRAMTQEEADQIYLLVDSISATSIIDYDLWNIISEGINNYINNHGTAEDATRIIQNRVSIFLSEQSK